VNIIVQTLIDAQAMLGCMRQKCSAQECERLDALCSHLTYLITTTEVVAELPGDAALPFDIKTTPRPSYEPTENYIGRGDVQAIRWVPEAPGHPGLYAAAVARCNGKRNCTGNIHDAIQFNTKQICANWCAENPVPKFTPMEHMFMGEPQ
jgi:hypothetical protein